eukprot:CAMPEP_0117009044 /NCGR_PEP_ID=MMETSP0472-20121206/8331_1 /TAXON_ID=693140 ORGANISM="Tiarina fusus, Strain LIS" /NCGR_SAMPLE_ID=MMETSP0472 /ASSEMBLY_ACC=CAM_ASM_000603 /LENGTH=379 /DNA_ID=CAMNT_0004711233 /DNA_START=41 /DNA_END=1177 /DNA_ORIENTATION=+
MAKTKRSRKGKKAWRKNVNVADEEDMGVLQDTEDKRLFVVDKPKKSSLDDLTRKQKRQEILRKPMFEEKMSTPIGKPKRTDIPRKTETNKYIQRLADQLESKRKSEIKQTEKVNAEPVQNVFDLWGSDISGVNSKASKRFKEARKELPSSKLTDVDPGQSYHPTTADHQKLLQKALDQVTTKLDPELKATEKMKPTAPRRPDVEVKWNYSDSESEEESEEEMDEEDKRTKEINKHYSTKFTKTQRNKMKKRKELVLKRRRDARRGDKSVDRLQALLDGIAQQEKEKEEKLEKRRQHKEYKNGLTKKVGKMKYQSKPIDFLYSDEIPSSFRKLKPTNTLSEEIFNNFERRNMVESRRPKLQRYRKVKYMETREAKNFNVA